jgi:competence ComEA-like helix-hairpin-helix protein
MLLSVMGSYGVAKEASGGATGQGATGQGVTSAGTTGQGDAGQGIGTEGISGVGISGSGQQGISGEAGPGQGFDSPGPAGAVNRGLGNESSSGQRVGSSQGKPQEYMPPGKLNVNMASSDELVTVPGINRPLADNIIAYRESNGPFDSVDELMNVQGVDQERLDKSRPFLKVQGASSFEYDLEVSPPRPNPFPRYATEAE